MGYNYDELYRRDEIIDDPSGTPATIAQWAFYGAGRVAELMFANGLICTQLNNARTNTAVQTSVANPAWGDQSSDRLGFRLRRGDTGQASAARRMFGGNTYAAQPWSRSGHLWLGRAVRGSTCMSEYAVSNQGKAVTGRSGRWLHNNDLRGLGLIGG